MSAGNHRDGRHHPRHVQATRRVEIHKDKLSILRPRSNFWKFALLKRYVPAQHARNGRVCDSAAAHLRARTRAATERLSMRVRETPWRVAHSISACDDIHMSMSTRMAMVAGNYGHKDGQQRQQRRRNHRRRRRRCHHPHRRHWCVPWSLPPFLPSYLPTSPPSYLPTSLSSYLPTFLPSYLPTLLHTYMYLLTFLLSYHPTFLLPPLTHSPTHSHTLTPHHPHAMVPRLSNLSTQFVDRTADNSSHRKHALIRFDARTRQRIAVHIPTMLHGNRTPIRKRKNAPNMATYI